MLPGRSAPDRPRGSEDKLYKAVLDFCVHGIEQFQVTEARPSGAVPKARDAPSSPLPQQLSPRLSQEVHQQQKGIPLASSAPSMNLAPLHGAPPRGPAGRGSGLPNMPLGRQDSRSNLAVQPAAAPVQLTLKKAAVKLVQPAKPLTTAPRLPPAAPANSTTPNVRLSTPLPALMELQSSSSSSSPMESKHSAISGDTDAEAILGARFARLDFLSGSTKGNPGVKAKKEALGMPQLSPISEAKLRLDTFNKKYCTPTPDQAASEYLQKAAEYLDSLPSAKSPTVHLVQTVAEKIRSPISPPKITNGAIEHTQAKVANAVTTYVNGLKQDGQGTSMEQVMQFLKDVNGNFLFLCATLANRSLINITCLNEVIGLCKVILDTMPPKGNDTSDIKSPNIGFTLPLSKDPMAGLKAWPEQEKRESVSAARTCILKGVSSLMSYHELQALVWGGKVEELKLPEPGSQVAKVKFLAAEACDTYFKATRNGVSIPGKRDIVYIEKEPGPNSTNDVIRNCIDGGATRCIRALDADADWTVVALTRLASGKGNMKREIDQIKQGKTPEGRFFIEFRFAKILHALSFKQYLNGDEEWEQCSIAYGPDPCEVAKKVHPED